MRKTRLISAAIVAVLAASPAFAQSAAPSSGNDRTAVMAAGANVAQGQRKLTPEQQADTDGLLALVKAAPDLPMRRVELKLKAGTLLGPVSAVTADKAGNIYVFHRPTDPSVDPVVVLDPKGNIIRTFGKNTFTIPHGIKVDPRGNVWLIDAHTSMVYKFSAEGKKLMEVSVGDIPDPKRPFCGATDVAFKPDGHFYISDGYCNTRVIEYDASGKKLHEWGAKGTGPGQFNLVHDVSLAADGTLYVADRENGRLQWFDESGKFLGEKHFGGQLFSVSVAPDGDVFVGAHGRGVPYEEESYIIKFDPKSGKVLGKVEGFAHQLTVASDGTLLPGPVTVKIGSDPTTTSILMFRPEMKAGH